jgi:hypothetical protein
LKQWCCGLHGREEDCWQREGTESWRRASTAECVRGLGGERANEASTAAAIEEQDGTLATTPPFVFALRRRAGA